VGVAQHLTNKRKLLKFVFDILNIIKRSGAGRRGSSVNKCNEIVTDAKLLF